MTNKGLRPKLLKSSTRIRMPTELGSQHISGPDFGLSFKLAIGTVLGRKRTEES